MIEGCSGGGGLMLQLGWRAGRGSAVFFLTVADDGGWIVLSFLVVGEGKKMRWG